MHRQMREQCPWRSGMQVPLPLTHTDTTLLLCAERHRPEKGHSCLFGELGSLGRKDSAVSFIHLSAFHPLVGLESNVTTQCQQQHTWMLGLSTAASPITVVAPDIVWTFLSRLNHSVWETPATTSCRQTQRVYFPLRFSTNRKLHTLRGF